MPNITIAAINAAIRADWETAIKLNQDLLKTNPHDVETLNRLGFAFIGKGDFEQARKCYGKVLRIDKNNPIAEKNLRKIGTLARGSKIQASTRAGTLDGHATEDISAIFLEEPGKTKITRLKNLAEPHVLSRLRSADEVTLVIKRHSIFIKSLDETYIGALPDDISHRLIPFIKGGSLYSAFIKSVERNEVSILIKEQKRGNRFKNNPSFLSSTTSYYSFVREDAIKEERRPNVTSYEDLEDGGDDKEEESSS